MLGPARPSCSCTHHASIAPNASLFFVCIQAHESPAGLPEPTWRKLQDLRAKQSTVADLQVHMLCCCCLSLLLSRWELASARV